MYLLPRIPQAQTLPHSLTCRGETSSFQNSSYNCHNQFCLTRVNQLIRYMCVTPTRPSHGQIRWKTNLDARLQLQPKGRFPFPSYPTPVFLPLQYCEYQLVDISQQLMTVRHCHFCRHILHIYPNFLLIMIFNYQIITAFPSFHAASKSARGGLLPQLAFPSRYNNTLGQTTRPLPPPRNTGWHWPKS